MQDHPRLCGEKRSTNAKQYAFPGSPPPMRGKDRCTDRHCSRIRITPAYAGKSGGIRFESKLTEDHPRLCGEKAKRQIVRILFTGSPPPMRGKVYGTTLHGQPHRITPAYAGKRRRTGRQTRSNQDHPRLCGEKVLEVFRHMPLPGSPPPMRGKA
mgnify:CR=1 FL=1